MARCGQRASFGQLPTVVRPLGPQGKEHSPPALRDRASRPLESLCGRGRGGPLMFSRSPGIARLTPATARGLGSRVTDQGMTYASQSGRWPASTACLHEYPTFGQFAVCAGANQHGPTCMVRSFLALPTDFASRDLCPAWGTCAPYGVLVRTSTDLCKQVLAIQPGAIDH